MPLSSIKIYQSQQLVIGVFKQFRKELMDSYGKIDYDSKHDGSPVTELDVKLETVLKQRLAEEYPEIGFQGEETEDTPGVDGAKWVVDPIDGTSSFIHGLPYCTNMAGLVVDNVIVASVIYQFTTDDLYTAIRGEGAYLNRKRIFVNNTQLDDSIVFSGSFAYKNLYGVFGPYSVGMYAPIGASGYEFTRLAEGSIQGVTKLRSGSKVHDDVPGVLLVTEAGGEIVSFENDEYYYEDVSFVAATPNLAAVVRKHKKEIADIIAT